jgi:hypothetical protein
MIVRRIGWRFYSGRSGKDNTERENNKATGFDGIPAEFWKISCSIKWGTEILTSIFNKVKNGKKFPSERKIAKFF